MSVKKGTKPRLIKNPKLEELQKKLDKVKGDIHISKRKTWFSEAMENLDKQEKYS